MNHKTLETFNTYSEARARAKLGEEVWARNSAKAADRTGWCVMTTAQANEYVRANTYKEWTHWETVK